MTPALAAGDYGPIAAFYDRYTDDPRFEDWVLSCVTLGVGHEGSGRALDVGCGTGRTTRPLLELGYEVTGVDPSAAMLAVAETSLAGAARLVRCRAEDIPATLGPFDLAIWLNDGCNHLHGVQELGSAFSAIGSSLRPGGILIFDANRRGIFDSVFTTDHTRVSDDLTFHWRALSGIGAQGRRLARASLEVWATNSDRKLATFEHVQRYHADQRVRRLLDAAELDLVSAHGFDNDGRIDAALTAESPKALYIARKPSSPNEERRCHA